MIVVGIDYSMTSPAMCVHQGENFSIENCQFHYLTPQKSKISGNPQFKGNLLQDYTHQMARFNFISDWAIQNIPNHETFILGAKNGPRVYLEGYAFAAKGQVFNIGENTGLLKYKLWHFMVPCEVVAPGTVKKFGVGKGNAKKNEVIDAFVEDTGLDLHSIIGTDATKKNTSPTNDIADSYFICKLGHHLLSSSI